MVGTTGANFPESATATASSALADGATAARAKEANAAGVTRVKLRTEAAAAPVESVDHGGQAVLQLPDYRLDDGAEASGSVAAADEAGPSAN